MWFIIYNEKAFWAIVPGILAGLGMASYSKNATISVLAGGIVTLIVDFVGRLKGGEASPALIHPDAGGHLWFIPAWIIGGLIAVFSVVSWFGKI